MKKVKRRAQSALLIAGMLVIGLCVYLIRLADDGRDWATFEANRHIYHEGILDTGTLLDRNGVVLAHAGDGTYYYAEDAAVRTSCLHTVGDYAGFIGTGIINAFPYRLANYSFVNGTYSRDGNGATLQLTIDSKLNVAAYNALAGRRGTVLIYNYETGDILCMASSPSYDPNTTPDLSSSSMEGVYLNRAISSTFTPGSVFKIVTLAAAIENIDDLYTRTFSCSGGLNVGGEFVKCSGTHGEQSIEQAFANSCNSAFAELSLELGPELLAEYAEKLGLVSAHDLNGIETAAGSFDKAAEGSGSLAWSGIGQYNDLVSPYALLRVVGAVANGGTAVEPTLILGDSEGKTKLLSSETAATIAEMMSYNVTYSYGAWNFPNLDICAKTGTAEVGNGASHAWFAGFLKNSDAPLAFVVLVENGGGGLAAAGSVANSVLQAAVS
jgi:cell division protein FtsI/penicillin-binding protein 2